MNRPETFVFGMALGAGLTYFLDPDKGARRRNLLRDRFVHAGHELEDAAVTNARHARNRAGGLAHEVRAGLTEDGVDDRVLSERVRSGIGRAVSNPGAIDVAVDSGRVTLSGSVPSDEVQGLVRTVKSIRGVDGVENRMQAGSGSG